MHRSKTALPFDHSSARTNCHSHIGTLWNIRTLKRFSLRLDASELDHLAPLLGFIGDELAELGRRSRQRRAAEVSETGAHLGIGERRVDLLVELIDDLGRRVSGCTDPIQ